MTSHQQIYKAANWLGAGCLLLSVFMGSIQLLMKAGHQHETDEKKALIESRAQVAEKQAELKSREMEAYRKGDTPNYQTLIATDRSRDESAPTGHLISLLVASNQQTLMLDKYKRCWGIWKPKTGFTKDFNVCNDPNSPLLKDK
jgi:hypothetical protein